MAHPFASIPLGFAVMGSRTLWWGGCAWDSFALPHLLPDEPEVLVSTTCPGCRAPHAWTVGRDAPPAGTQVAHFLVPVAHIWDDVVHTCGHQRLFCNEECVDGWLAATGNTKGYVMDLATLWRLAARLVRGTPRTRLHAARPEHRGGVLPRGRSQRPVLGACGLTQLSTEPSPFIITVPGMTRSRHAVTSRMPKFGELGESQPGMIAGS